MCDEVVSAGSQSFGISVSSAAMESFRIGAVPTIALVLMIACSGTSRPLHSSASVVGAYQHDVLASVDLTNLPRFNGRLEEAFHAATAVVLGIRQVQDECGTYIDLRLFPEVHLGGHEARESGDKDDIDELRALLYLPNTSGKCDEPLAQMVETNRVVVGDRVVVALGNVVGFSRDMPAWKKKPRVVAMGPIDALPSIVAALPKARLRKDSEQFLPIPRNPPVGTPASVRLLGKRKRFDVVGEEIVDQAQGIVWQRDLAGKTMPFEEAAAYCEAQRTAGHDDWRLPTAAEMHGIFAPAISPPALVDPKPFSVPEQALLWTRTDDDGPWVGVPEEGIVISTHYDDPSPYGSYYVRCVRPGEMRVTEMVDRFAQKDSLLQDVLSGLSWYLEPKGEGITQAAARRFCEQGTFGGFDDWQLPTAEAAFSLMSGCPDAVSEWEGKAEDVWASMVDPQVKVGSTFRLCNLHRSVPLAAIFNEEGVDAKNPLARVMCMRETHVDAAPSPQPCPMGAQEKRDGAITYCEEKGVRHGPFRSYWPNGSIFEIGSYDHGVRSGTSRMYHESGGIYTRSDYMQRKLHGEVWSKRPSGMPLFNGKYENGLPTGHWTFYDPQGREVERIDMMAGKPGGGMYVRYGDKNAKIIECPTLAGWEHGVSRFFDDETRELTSETTYDSGWLEGTETSFDDKRVTGIGHYHRGELDGVWERKNKEGIVVFRQ